MVDAIVKLSEVVPRVLTLLVVVDSVLLRVGLVVICPLLVSVRVGVGVIGPLWVLVKDVGICLVVGRPLVDILLTMVVVEEIAALLVLLPNKKIQVILM